MVQFQDEGMMIETLSPI